MYVPLLQGIELSGVIALENMDLENAFGEADLRLLTTLANSMSVALENARLFDETQRLLKETEQRAAELAIINSVQEGLASNLEMQAIYDLVGDKIREIFDAQVVKITTFDARTSNLSILTLIGLKKVRRFLNDPYPLSALGTTSARRLDSRSCINQDWERLMRELGFNHLHCSGYEAPNRCLCSHESVEQTVNRNHQSSKS